MVHSPLVSIIINNYNYEKFLRDAIDSALNQSYDNVEVIVVDDGSTDTSRDIIRSYGDRLIPLFQENAKQGAAFNNGFAHSKGDIILFLDSDDYLFEQTLEKIVEVWNPTVSKVHYRLQIVDAQGEIQGPCYPPRNLPLASGEVWKELFDRGAYTGVSTSGNAISRHALAEVSPIPEKYKLTSDDYLSTLIPFYGEVVAIDEPLAAYRIHTSNQWALVTVSGDRFHRFVHHHNQSQALIEQQAEKMNYSLPDDLEERNPGYVWCRLSSLRLGPSKHPKTKDTSFKLMYWGIRSLWKYSDFNIKKRLIYSIWFVWVAIMPLPLAKLAITWLYVPQNRPKLLDWAKQLTSQKKTVPIEAVN
ncbi:glycosyl transferase, group 2 family protein [Synechococcus sp. PCC 7335]|uniref:glycosyltransferase n=1 Tax=Synechococcus sp. (strain ATCC 29403 / PCC 7335) TaxID=91464 RepID=UPI00017ED99B|nr:glycosyltransferase [Synechococcus sp. PCC 7335]EDX86091.1 glycosyl transferase, group 2 family protein [Synechococcus sp. PCC 7335]